MVDSCNKGGAEAEHAITVSKAFDGRQARSLEVDLNPDPPNFQRVKDVFDSVNREPILLVLLNQPYQPGIERYCQ
jgi:hypothetical protein